MMNEWNSLEKEERESLGVDERLSAYYGPTLREQPLPTSSWLRLRSQLGPQRSSRRLHLRWEGLRRYKGNRTVPALIQNAFSRIAYEARIPYGVSMLACSVKLHVHVPRVQVSLLKRRSIRLTLPMDAIHSMELAMLDVLLATGLARYLCMRKPGYVLSRLLLYSVIPLACIMLALLSHRLPLQFIPIALALCIIVCVLALWLLHMQWRAMAFRADTLVVQWLGRGRACQGLHMLADRSRTPSRRQWNELALTERIGRVCGTEVSIENERLTLVR